MRNEGVFTVVAMLAFHLSGAAFASGALIGSTAPKDSESTQNPAPHASVELADKQGETAPGVWQAYGGLPNGCNGVVVAIADTGEGTFVIAGNFTVCGDTYARHVAQWDGENWRALGTGGANGVDGRVSSVAMVGADVFVAGEFDTAGGVLARNIARWDGQLWSSVTAADGGTLNAAVEALAAHDGVLYVGGYFTQIGDVTANRIAAWNGADWASLGTGADNGVGDQPYEWVSAISVGATGVYVGGQFGSAGQHIANNVARWDGSGWSSIGSGLENGVDGYVLALENTDDGLYVGGDISDAGSQDVRNIALWNGNGWDRLGQGDDYGIFGTVGAIEATSAGIYAGGSFNPNSGGHVSNITRWDGSYWYPVRYFMFPGEGVNGPVAALQLVDGNLVVGGSFDHCFAACNNIVKVAPGGSFSEFDAGSGQGFNHVVRAIASDETSLYAAGDFSLAGRTHLRNLAEWNEGAWRAFPGSGFTSYEPGSMAVLALAIRNDDLFVGGQFDTVNGVTVYNVTRWDGSNWHALGSPPGTDSFVGHLRSSPDRIYVGGIFISAGGLGSDYVSSWNGDEWLPFGDNSSFGFGDVKTTASAHGFVYAGGFFGSLYGFEVTMLAKWDGAVWSQVGSEPSDLVNGPVTVMAAVGDDLYVAGHFTMIGSLPVNGIARWDGSSWHTLPGTEGVGVVGHINTMAVHDKKLYVGGELEQVGGMEVNGVACWDGNQWIRMGSAASEGVEGEVFALSSDGAGVYVGGQFSRAGGQVSVNIAKWIPDSEVIFGHGFELPSNLAD